MHDLTSVYATQSVCESTVRVAADLGALLLMWAGCAKLLSFRKFVGTVQTFGVPKCLVRSVALFLPVLELTCSVCVLVGIWEPYPAIVAATLFLLFAAILALALATGRTTVECGCFGSTGKPISWWLVVRNSVVASGVVAFVYLPKSLIIGAPTRLWHVGAALGLCLMFAFGTELTRICNTLVRNNRHSVA
jgi:uncharacterized membrane protein YphA (DoxX/SURF4 family)